VIKINLKRNVAGFNKNEYFVRVKLIEKKRGDPVAERKFPE